MTRKEMITACVDDLIKRGIIKAERDTGCSMISS